MECGAGLGLVLILRWYWWRISAWSEIAATIAPFIAYGFVKYSGVVPAEYSEYPNSFFITVLVTTVSWIAVTFLTKPTDTATLERFYAKVKPDGAWKPFAEKSNAAASNQNLLLLTIAWLLAICMGYSILFAIGKIILMEWTMAAIFVVVAATSTFAFNYITQKAKLFEE
jgi:hypothetical protein